MSNKELIITAVIVILLGIGSVFFFVFACNTAPEHEKASYANVKIVTIDSVAVPGSVHKVAVGLAYGYKFDAAAWNGNEFDENHIQDLDSRFKLSGYRIASFYDYRMIIGRPVVAKALNGSSKHAVIVVGTYETQGTEETSLFMATSSGEPARKISSASGLDSTPILVIGLPWDPASN